MAEIAVAPRIVLTVVFLAIGAVCVRRAIGGAPARTRDARIADAAHVLMSGSMLSMLWFRPFWPAWQMAAFAVAGGWFAVRAVDGGDRGAARVRWLHHGLVMGAMVWMLDVMRPDPMPMMAMRSAASASFVAAGGGIYCLATAVLLLGGCGFAVVRRGFHTTGYGILVRDDLVYALMAAGMSAMLFAMM